MTNPKRGEMQIKLGETTYKARVTLNSIITIETSLSMGMFKIMQKLTEGDLSTSDMIQILKPIIRGGGNDISEKDIIGNYLKIRNELSKYDKSILKKKEIVIFNKSDLINMESIEIKLKKFKNKIKHK